MQYAGTRLEPGVVKERENTRAGSVDFPFAALTLLLLTIGVVMVLSASYARAYYSAATGHNAAYYFLRQLGFAAAGTAAMLVLARLPMAFYRRMSFPLMALSVALLAAVPFIGAAEGGARRWIDLGFTTFQPSEIAKAAVILYFSALICRFRAAMRTFRYGIAPFAGILALIVGLLVLEPHFSAAVIILAIGGAMLFLGGARLYWFIGVGVLGLAGLGVVMTFFPYASGRVATWLDPFANTSGDGYQIVQSLYSIGSGGLFGLGLGRGRQTYMYLPEEHNDFIFAVVCEELGFAGAAAILLLFAALIVRGYWLAMHMDDRYSFLVTAGITTLLAIQVILNVAVVTNLVPCTGISLPFFSYGGTALMLQLAEMGIVLSASRGARM